MLDQYFNQIAAGSWFDIFIICVGAVLMLAHIHALLLRLAGRRRKFVQDLGRRQQFLLSLIEILPMLGLIGTVIGLLNTFALFDTGESAQPDLSTVVKQFAPALTTTLSGLAMAVPNLVLNALLWSSLPRGAIGAAD